MVTCEKKDQYGKQCQREQGHSGACINDERYFVAGWIDQGAKPARRKFFLWIACFAFMLSIPLLFLTWGASWYAWVLLILIFVIPVMGAPQIKRMFEDFQKERRSK